jgi:hypothetical protein
MKPFLRVGFGALLLAWLGGCGGPDRPPFDPTGQHKMEEIGHMLVVVREDGQRPPAQLADLDRLEPLVPLSVQELRSGDVVYFWGAGLSTEGNASSTVLAHEKKVPSEGGWVLMQDGSVRQMTSDEFQAAPKAR